MNKNLFQTFNIFLTKNKRIILSATLFSFVFFSLGVPYKKWWFIGGEDDYIDPYELGYKTKNWKWHELSYFFYDGHTQPQLNDPNYKRTTFFTTSYRPLCCIGIALRYRLFGTNIYHYHLANVFVHAINAVLLFNIFLWLLSFLPALLLALIWAFHPLISWFFGNIVNFHYYVNVMLMLFVFIFFKFFLDTRKWKYYFLSCITFATSLFTRETSIVLPGIIFFGTYLYQNKSSKIGIKHFYKSFFKILITTSGIITTAIGFLLLRLYLYPINLSVSNSASTSLNTTNYSIITYFKNAAITSLNCFKLFIYDLFGLSWIPWDSQYKTLRISLFLLILSTLIWFFIKNTKKIHVTYLFLCMLIMLWPSYIKGIFSHGYFYEAYPFIFLAIIFLFKFYNGNLKKSNETFNVFKKAALPILGIITMLFITLTIKSFSRRERRINTRTQAIKTLAYDPIIKNKSLYFFGLPYGAFVTNTKKAFWMLLDNPNIPIFFDISLSVKPTNIHVNEIPSWKIILSKYYFEKFTPASNIVSTKINHGFRFKSIDPQKVSFIINDNYESNTKKIINNTVNIKGKDLITDITILFDQKDLKPNTLFITWDYKKAKFKILGRNI